MPMRNIFAIIALLTSLCSAADLTNQFVQGKLAYGATIDIPRTWKVLQGSEMRAIEVAVGAAADLTGLARQAAGTESLLVANFDNPRLYASVTVTAISIRNSSSRSLDSFTAADVKAGEATLRKGVESMLAGLGTKAAAWTPLEKVPLGDNFAMHTSYLRSSEAGERRVHMYKVFGTGRVYDIVVSTALASEDINNVILLGLTQVELS